jgi:single-stranded-DNA-specific exonuclease
MTFVAAKQHWNVASFDLKRAAALAAEADVSPLIAHLLLLRGMDTPQKMRDFLSPSLSQLTSPFDLTDMQIAVDRIIKAQKQGESILVFGDYDVDGIAATAIMTRGLRRFGIRRVDCDMPDRFAEGYGITPERVAEAHRQGFDLIITVDNGISAHAAAQRARDIGLDMIITDHHALDPVLPPAVAVINPKRDHPDHPAYMLAGAGVALKLTTALNGAPYDLDIAALGTISDIVPLLLENRVIAALGIKHMVKYGRIGISKLARTAHFDLAEITSQKIAFQLGPRLNAAGRLDTGHTALELLMTESPEQAAVLADALNKANEERRSIEQKIYDEAEEILEAFLGESQRSIVLAQDDWHQGVIGIVASRIQVRYQRPVIICCLVEDGLLRGSGRSGGGFDMVAALNACAQHLVTFGGHAAAAGLALKPESLESFRDAFEEQVLLQLGPDKIASCLDVDAIVALSQLNAAFIQRFECMAPFGQGNPEPVFCAAGVEVVPQSMRILKEQHLKFTVRQGDAMITALGFRMAERYFTEEIPEKLDIVFSPSMNTYNGETSLQLILKDMRAARKDDPLD